MPTLRVVAVKPSKYDRQGYVQRFTTGFMPNATLPTIMSMVPDAIGNHAIVTRQADEYIQTNLDYLNLLDASTHDGPTLVMLVGVQSHQFHRALDLGAMAQSQGCMVVMGGPHPMTCDTTMFQGKGISFSLAEGELVLGQILDDAVREEELRPVYGTDERWQKTLNSPVLKVDRKQLGGTFMPMLGVYPFRGCPFTCEFCSVIKVAGRKIRSQPIETIMATLKAAKEAGVKMIFFTSDNFNKFPKVVELCQAIIDAKLRQNFFVQCDTQIANQPELLDLFARAGVFQIFMGVESLSLAALKSVHKMHNKPNQYQQIREMCTDAGINSHFSMINGFASDTMQSALDQLDQVKRINPDIASFYTLTPLPGTEQYDKFMQDGLITETNLDRFDGSCPTWNHPNLSWRQLDDIFRRYYLDFYTMERAEAYRPRGNQMPRESMRRYTQFARACAMSGEHPMSGGFDPVRLDHVGEYIKHRKRAFDIELAPLPASLKLSPAEETFNKGAKLH